MAAGKREDSAERSRAEHSRAGQCSCDGSNHTKLRTPSVRGGKGGVGGGNEEEEWEKGCLALPPGLHHRRDEDVGGEDSVVGAREEEIQLVYRRIKCIFNHNAVFPDVTVKPLWETVRQPLKEELPSLSLSLFYPCSSVDQQHNT